MEDLHAAITRLKERLGASLCIMGHHYQNDAVVRHCDITGDSLELARRVPSVTAEHIVFCGVYFMGEYANVVVGSTLLTILFLGGWDCPLGLWPGPHWLLIKLYAVIFTVVWIRWTFPRTTFYGLLNLSWKVLIPVALINLLLTSALLKVF